MVQDNIKVNHNEMGWEDVDWIYLPKYRVKWWAVIDMVIIFGFYKMRISSPSEQVLTSQEGFCSELWTFLLLFRSYGLAWCSLLKYEFKISSYSCSTLCPYLIIKLWARNIIMTVMYIFSSNCSNSVGIVPSISATQHILFSREEHTRWH